ncbi:hypothetical protein NZD89_27935 (plasmid) [Alicyclobacillus fastidiosus]|uniref:DNA ligase (ATP) n=2 Tax=Alicyclobacillus fastidiosus TaxID=392011 RepID=A0ABY6ZPG7_9BACL|nr:hypothetical protein [Alicyclobacillus fastidiosus]WAH44880.1 hypothetical protein NZD89_27935 [Alicyclobacillus fastidiosus]
MRKEPFDSTRYLFEPKADGWRLLLHKQGSRIEVYTRNGNVVTKQFPEFQSLASLISSDEVILDGEGACFSDNRFWFERFDSRARLNNPNKIVRALQEHPATFFVFDVLYRDGESCMSLDLLQRKTILHDIVLPGPHMSIVPFVEGEGISLWEQTKALGWEGIVAKRLPKSAYRLETRSDMWLKIKHWTYADVSILGYQRSPFRLIVGDVDCEGKLVLLGSVEYGFRQEEKTAFLRIVPQLHTLESKGIQWVRPSLRAQVKFLDRTSKGKLRIPSFEKFII